MISRVHGSGIFYFKAVYPRATTAARPVIRLQPLSMGVRYQQGKAGTLSTGPETCARPGATSHNRSECPGCADGASPGGGNAPLTPASDQPDHYGTSTDSSKTGGGFHPTPYLGGTIDS